MTRALRRCTVAALLVLGLPLARAQSDPTFAPAGLLQLPWSQAVDSPDVVLLAPDGGSFIVHEASSDLVIVRLDADGRYIGAYTGGGISRVAITMPFGLNAGHVEADGALLLGGVRDLVRITPSGRLDLGYGQSGRLRIPYLTDSHCLLAAVRKILPDAGGGRIVVAAFAGMSPMPPNDIRACTFVARVSAGGVVDASFGTEGNLVRSGFEAFDAQMRADGSVELAGRYIAQDGSWVERVSAAGRLQLAFGTNGSLKLPSSGALLQATDGKILADGSRIFVASTLDPTVVLYRYDANGVFVDSFAGLGRSVLPARDGAITGLKVLPLPDGGFIVRGNAVSTGTAISVFYKVHARGLPDASFGDAGYSRHLAARNSRLMGWEVQPDGYVLFTGVSFSGFGPIPPGIPPAPTPLVAPTPYAARIQAVPNVVEFHNTFINHYFLAYDGVEALGIDAGAAGPGWVRTRQSFRPGGLTPVCRFYGTPGVGPNSHFFTIEPGECEEVKQSHGWTYEGLGFHATRLAGGQCAAGLRTVIRLYNNRHMFNDANHRFVTDPALVPAMAAGGWVLEGPVFCVKP